MHVAGAADHAREGVHEPHEPGAGEHHVRVGERRLERAALPAERRVELPAEGDHRDREQDAETAVDEERVEHERVGQAGKGQKLNNARVNLAQEERRQGIAGHSP